MRKYFFVLCCCVLAVFGANAQNVASNGNADSVAVVNQLNGFIKAFEYLDFEQFKTYFADDVTVFFPPSAMVAGRIDGKDNVMKVFKSFFERVKLTKKTAPYLDIVPQKTQFNFYDDIVLVTFELNDANALSRRTILLRKISGRFLIIHLHASKIDGAK